MLRIFGPKREEATEGWRKLYNELQNLFFMDYQSGQIKKDEMGKICMGQIEICIQILGRKSDGKRSLGRSVQRWAHKRSMMLWITIRKNKRFGVGREGYTRWKQSCSIKFLTIMFHIV
jgi:hypothetical protein